MTIEHLDKECDENGRPKENNLHANEISGLRGAMELVKTSNGIIYQTDKSGKLCIDSNDNYAKMMKPHVENDQVIDEKEKEKIVRNCNGHSASWSRMVNLCCPPMH